RRLQWHRWRRLRGSRSRLRGTTEGLVQHRCRRTGMRRHDLQYEGETQEEAARPPRHRGQQVARLSRPNERVSRRADAAKARGDASAFTALQENGGDEDRTVEDEDDQKERIHRLSANNAVICGPTSSPNDLGPRDGVEAGAASSSPQFFPLTLPP